MDGALPQADPTQAGTTIVELRVSDDGRGFDPNDVPPDRLGLGIMRERAEAIGATFEVESTPGEGTRVSVVWPGTTDGG